MAFAKAPRTVGAATEKRKAPEPSRLGGFFLPLGILSDQACACPFGLPRLAACAMTTGFGDLAFAFALRDFTNALAFFFAATPLTLRAFGVADWRSVASARSNCAVQYATCACAIFFILRACAALILTAIIGVFPFVTSTLAITMARDALSIKLIVAAGRAPVVARHEVVKLVQLFAERAVVERLLDVARVRIGAFAKLDRARIIASSRFDRARIARKALPGQDVAEVRVGGGRSPLIKREWRQTLASRQIRPKEDFLRPHDLSCPTRARKYRDRRDRE